MGCMAVGRSSRERLLPGRMQGDTRKDPYLGHPSPFLWHEGSPRYTKAKRRSRHCNGDNVQGSNRRSVSSSPSRQKQRKRGGKCRSGRGGQKRKMRKTDRLSKRYFRIYSWKLCKCQQTRCCPGKDGLWLWCDMPVKEQGHAQIGHWCFKTSQSFRGIKAVVWQWLFGAISARQYPPFTRICGPQAHRNCRTSECKNHMRDSNVWFSSVHTCTPPPAPQEQVGISLRGCTTNLETQSWYVVI